MNFASNHTDKVRSAVSLINKIIPKFVSRIVSLSLMRYPVDCVVAIKSRDQVVNVKDIRDLEK